MHPPWADDFVIWDSASPTSLELRQPIGAGSLIRVIRGAYLPKLVASQRGPRAAHRDLAYAHELLRPGRHVFSHVTAASIWRIPRLGSWPSRVHVTTASATGGRSTGGMVRHARDGIDSVVVDGLRTTMVEQTVVDIAASEGFVAGVVAADAAIRALGADALRCAALSPSTGARGAARVRAAISFADGRAESPGESLSRVRMLELGLPAPHLQFEIVDDAGPMFADFAWPQLGAVGEFDGVAKYVRDEYTRGRSAAEVVLEEKRREDRIRALGWRVARWGWPEAQDARRLARVLANVGVVPQRPRHL